jgi:hypothetical protein
MPTRQPWLDLVALLSVGCFAGQDPKRCRAHSCAGGQQSFPLPWVTGRDQ